MKNLIIIGDGGHSKVVQSIIKAADKYNIIEIWDDKYTESFCEQNIVYKQIDGKSPYLTDQTTLFFIAIGDNNVRHQKVQFLGCPENKYAIIMHPSATVDQSVELYPGTLIMAGAVVQYGSCLSSQVIVNTRAVVEHDCKLGRFAHVAPNATLTGGSQVGNLSFIGAGSVLLPQIKVADQVIVGAGSVVTKDVEAGSVVMGNPAKVK
ncbi:acetyltransferase [Listeria sp. PSOL-1]|uniref:acetyltransferase n=1 Tax=Listeria sp. PSOL-1 TaxID=1844999 RepID=UPI0013D4ECB9|nr:acetyltransferase [Listeria sp. PSOL-1]